jgi:hypothetical protein
LIINNKSAHKNAVYASIIIKANIIHDSTPNHNDGTIHGGVVIAPHNTN